MIWTTVARLAMKWFNPEKIITGAIQAYMKAKDIDLEKFRSSNTSTAQLATAILDANVKHSEIKANYALAILQWWPFRLILFILISFAATRFCLTLFDSTWWWIYGCKIEGVKTYGDACSWSFPPIKGTFGEAEKEFLLFFIIAKPVDTAISGALNLISKYLAKR